MLKGILSAIGQECVLSGMNNFHRLDTESAPMAVKPIPDGYHSVTPYLYVRGASDAIAFYEKAFNAVEVMRMDWGGKIGHAEIKIGESPVMLADEFPEQGTLSPLSLGGASSSLVIYVEDSDAITEQAIAAGATVLRPIQDQFYGDRSATLKDPFGHQWTISTHKEDVAPEEMDRRSRELMTKMASGMA